MRNYLCLSGPLNSCAYLRSTVKKLTTSALKHFQPSQGCSSPLFPPQVKEVYVKENDSIGEDEVILEFYQEEQ